MKTTLKILFMVIFAFFLVQVNVHLQSTLVQEKQVDLAVNQFNKKAISELNVLNMEIAYFTSFILFVITGLFMFWGDIMSLINKKD